MMHITPFFQFALALGHPRRFADLARCASVDRQVMAEPRRFPPLGLSKRPRSRSV
jgi:hypothetical protein